MIIPNIFKITNKTKKNKLKILSLKISIIDSFLWYTTNMKNYKTNSAIKTLFYIYSIFLFLFVIIKINNGLRGMDIFNLFRPYTHLKINLTPFNTIGGEFLALTNGISMNVLFHLGGNTIAFIPLGFFIGYLYEKTFTKTIFICFLISLFFESFQLLTNLGSFDIDDIILNVLSCIIGYLIYLQLKKIKIKVLFN